VGNQKGTKEPEMEKLSDILDEFNSINWTNKEIAKQQLDDLPTRLQADETFVNAVKNSNRETAMQQCASSMMAIVAGMLNENTEFCRYYLDHADFMSAVNQRVFSFVYDQLNKKNEEFPHSKVYMYSGEEEEEEMGMAAERRKL
jgi:type I restriction enzyme R subunit